MNMLVEDRKRADPGEGAGHEEQLITIEIMDNYLPTGELSGAPTGDYMTRLEKEKILNNDIKAAIEVSWKPITTKILGETREDAFAEGCDEQKE